jgi:two-component system, response regulator FlrC
MSFEKITAASRVVSMRGTVANEAPEPVAVADCSQRLIVLAQRVAASDCTVLIAGESGTGKEVLARFIHRQSPRAQRAFIAVNCAAIPESMLEALLFGYERGAFTGAHATHAGKFEQAQGGTLLLDEISEMPLGLQAKLLRVLQEREVERLGGQDSVALDVRVIATTNRNLRAEVAAGRFREDLYYRLNVFPLQITPLRQRRDDILPLATQLLAVRVQPGSAIPALSADAAHVLLTYSWPGNVRELDNVLQRALILCTGAMVEPSHLQTEPYASDADAASEGTETRLDALFDGERRPNNSGGALARTRERAEREVLLEALRAPDATRRDIAARLGISPRTLRYKLARLRAAGLAVPAA